MIGLVITIVLTTVIAFLVIAAMKRNYQFVNDAFLRRMLFFHLLLAVVYYLYAANNPSDSIGYYLKVSSSHRGENWANYYGTSSTFIEFIGYPFIKFFGFSYEAIMALFSFFGFLGFLFFYIFFKENIRYTHTFLGMDLITLIFLLPNLHFWSASFGKGSIIFMAIGLFFYGVSRIQTRWIAIVIGGVIIYHVRPHIMLVVLVSAAIGFMFSTKGISLPVRIAFLVAVGVAFYYIYSDVLSLVGIDEDDFITQGLDLTHRATELTKATSGVDITSYSLPLQIFTFLYRPLFFDAPGILGLIVSFENVFYLAITLRLLSLKGINYLIMSNFLVKTALFSFLTVTIALAQISGNLGLAIRQKSQVMILFLFVVVTFLDKKKLDMHRQLMWKRIRRARIAKLDEQKAV
jgi:hypothetical protein